MARWWELWAVVVPLITLWYKVKQSSPSHVGSLIANHSRFFFPVNRTGEILVAVPSDPMAQKESH